MFPGAIRRWSNLKEATTLADKYTKTTEILSHFFDLYIKFDGIGVKIPNDHTRIQFLHKSSLKQNK